MKITKSKIKTHVWNFVSATYAVYILVLGIAAVAVAGDELAIWEVLLFFPLLIVGSWFFLINTEYQRNFFRDPVRYMRQKRRTKNAVVRAEVLSGRKPTSENVAEDITDAYVGLAEDRKRRGG